MGRVRRALEALAGRDEARDLAALESILRDRGWTAPSGVLVDYESSLRHSGVWGACRLRANLVSMMPVDAFRKVSGYQVEVVKPDLLVTPYPGWRIDEWLWASQWDLDRYGNAVGIIHAVNALGLPAVVEPIGMNEVRIIVRDRAIKEIYIGGEKVDQKYVWHEAQYRPAGTPLGLSPLQAAAWTVGTYLSAQKFALEWFDKSKPMPRGTLRNTERSIPDPEKAKAIKASFYAAIQGGDIFVTGKDWEWTAEKVDAQSAGFMDQFRWGIADVARYFDVPEWSIGAMTPGASMTYANVTQQQLNLLVNHMSSAIKRREDKLSTALPKPRFVKLNTNAILRLDPEQQSKLFGEGINSRRLTPNEARALENRPPLTEEDISLFNTLFGTKNQKQPSQNELALWEAPK